MQRQLRIRRAAQDRLLERIPRVQDLQASWLLLRYCAAPRSNYLLRILPPALSEEYAGHDTAVARCLVQLLGYADALLPEDAVTAAQLAARLGGLGLRANHHAAHWASWCECAPCCS